MIEKTHLLREAAIDQLDGHTILSVDGARLVCHVLGVSVDLTPLTMTWNTREEAFAQHGFVSTVNPGSGINGLDLAWQVAEALGLDIRAIPQFSGRGYQSCAIQHAIRAHLFAQGKLNGEGHA